MGVGVNIILGVQIKYFNIRDALLKLLRLLMTTVPSLNLIDPSMRRMNFLMLMNLQRLIMVCITQYSSQFHSKDLILYTYIILYRCDVLSEMVRPIPS